MADCEELKRLLELELIPDLEEAIDELFETVADAKRADEAAKEEYGELQELRTAFIDLLHDLEAGEVNEEECEELYRELSDMAAAGEEEA
jgi:hypothetical protein